MAALAPRAVLGLAPLGVPDLDTGRSLCRSCQLPGCWAAQLDRGFQALAVTGLNEAAVEGLLAVPGLDDTYVAKAPYAQSKHTEALDC